MKTGKPWTPDDIESLIKTYKQRWREKKIAEALSRSTAAVGKKIDALNLRQLYGQERKEYCRRRKNLNLKKDTFQDQIRESKIKGPILYWVPTINGTPEIAARTTELGFNWVALENVIEWLASIDIQIQESPFKNSPYIYEGKYLSAGQILLRCN